MQTTIYYKEDDSYLIDKVEEKSNTERKSKSAVILSILENYFEAEKRVGEILRDLGVLKREHLKEALENQKDEKKRQKTRGDNARGRLRRRDRPGQGA